MTKKKMLFSVFGAIFGVGVLVLGWLLWTKMSLADENAMNLAGEEDKFNSYVTAKVFPCSSSLESIKTNRQTYAAWYDDVMAYVSRADRKPSTLSPAAFKQYLTESIAEMRKLPGGVGGRISVQTFNFGFDQFFGETAKMPAENEVPLLARELDAITRMVDIFADASIVEIKSIVRKNVVKVEEEKNPRNRRRTNRTAKKKTETGPVVTPLSFTVEYLVRPAAFVNVLNDFAKDDMFIVVKSISFKETADTIMDKFNAAESAKNAESQGRRGGARRRRGLAAAFGALEKGSEENPENAVGRLIVDPENAAPISVSLDLTVTDFGRAAGLEDKKAESETEAK